MRSKYVQPMPAFYKTSSGKRAVKGGPVGAPAYSLEYRRSLVRPQAQTIIEKFGGARELARTLRECSDDPKDHYDPSTIYRWMYPREKGGCDGEIPGPALKTVLRCARLAGILLTSEDIYPHLVAGPLDGET